MKVQSHDCSKLFGQIKQIEKIKSICVCSMLECQYKTSTRLNFAHDCIVHEIIFKFGTISRSLDLCVAFKGSWPINTDSVYLAFILLFFGALSVIVQHFWQQSVSAPKFVCLHAPTCSYIQFACFHLYRCNAEKQVSFHLGLYPADVIYPNLNPLWWYL